MANLAEKNYIFKETECVRLKTDRYTAVVANKMGSSVLRLHDDKNGIEIFRYKEETTAEEINDSREIWGLPTLYLPNRFFKGVLKTSDAVYQLPINEPLFDNFIHGWTHKREHVVEECYADENKAVVKTSFTFDKNDEMYKYFPLDYKISYTFTLSDEMGLVQEIELLNLSCKKLPVSICTHTCINAPICDGGSEEGLLLNVPIVEKCELNEFHNPTEKLLPLSDWDKEYLTGKKPTLQVICNDMYTAAMNTLDGEDFYGVVITDTITGKRIANEVSKEFKFWNMWNHDGDKGYFCPEPMTAMINSPNLSLPWEISGYNELSEGEKYTCSQRFFTL